MGAKVKNDTPVEVRGSTADTGGKSGTKTASLMANEDKMSDVLKLEMADSDYRSSLSEFDAQGYDDFCQRTEGMFATEEDTQKAFQQLLDRDFKGFAKNFDLSTKPDKAYFWSGDKEFADKIAKANGGTTMEGTPGGKVVDNWEWLEKKYPSSNWNKNNDLDPKPLWSEFSKEYARNVSGKVTYVNQGYEGAVWLEDESPIVDKLMDKGIVTSVDYYNKEYLINKILSEGEKAW